MTVTMKLPRRAGPAPCTTPTNPHTQLDQNAPPAMQEALARYMFGFECVVERPSVISVPGARAMWLDESCRAAAADLGAFMLEREFAHLHPPYDGSLHLSLPPELSRHAVEQGWAELHPMARRGMIPPTIVMVFGPRDEAELEVVKELVAASFRFAHGGEEGPQP
jgi:phospholipase/carboxylesterase